MDDKAETVVEVNGPEGGGRMQRRRSNATIIDVAREAGVSFKSVSRVLNGEKYVRPAMRERVQAAIDALGFVPNVAARTMRGKNYALGLLFDTSKGQYLLEVQNAAMKACRDARHHLIVESLSAETVDDSAALVAQLHGLQVDGLAVLPPLCDNLALLDELERQQIPFTRIAPTIELGRSAAIVVDDDRAVRDMIDHLWSLGHRRIGFITGNLSHLSAHRRRDAFIDEMGRRGQAVPADMVQQGTFAFDSGIAAAERLLDAACPPTAIFASNDEMAAGVIAAAMMRGLRLPTDLSICGFDDSPIARFTWPPLTTICQPLGEMAQAAIGHLLGDTSRPILRHLPLTLVQRASTAMVKPHI